MRCCAIRRRLTNTPSLHSRLIGQLLFVALAGGCGGGGDTGGTTGTQGSFLLSVSAPTLSIAKGSASAITIGVLRSGTFAGAISLAISGLPSGVTSTPSAPQIAAAEQTSSIALAASTSAAEGNYTITIRGSGAGAADQSVAFVLTVTPAVQAGPFTLAVSSSSYLVPNQAAFTWIPTLTITRNSGFTGAVGLSVTGLPSLLAMLVPTSTTSNSVNLSILNLGASNGTYTATIRGTGGGGEQTVTMQLVVASPTTGSIEWKYCQNPGRNAGYFFAVKDGSGPWTRIVPSTDGTTYSFSLTQSIAQVATVTIDSGVPRTTVYEGTAQEITALAASECTLYPGTTTRTATGTLTGLGTSELAVLGFGSWITASASFQNLASGALDLVAFRDLVDAQAVVTPNRFIIRRGLNPASGASVGTIDFNGNDAFAPAATTTWTFGNTNGESFSISEHFLTAAGWVGQFTPLPTSDRSPITRTIYAVPLAQTIAGDLHQVIATIGTLLPARPTRQAIAYFRNPIDRPINFGPTMPLPGVIVVSQTPAVRIRAQGTLPTEYNTGVELHVKSTGLNPRFASVIATRGFLGGGSAYDVQMPDLSSAVGWDTNWNLRVGDLTNWWVSGGGPILDFAEARYIFAATRARWTGATTGMTVPSEGAIYLIGRAAGTITP